MRDKSDEKTRRKAIIGIGFHLDLAFLYIVLVPHGTASDPPSSIDGESVPLLVRDAYGL